MTPPRIVLVNHSDSAGGASVVSFRLMEAMRRLGADARMLVSSRTTADPGVDILGNGFSRRMKKLWERGVIFAGNGFNRRDLFKVSIADTGFDVTSHPWVADADAVILNWINQGTMSIDSIARLADAKPVIWTMHDMWCMTGACHHAGTCRRFTDRCGNCPFFFNGRLRGDLSAITWTRKRDLYARSTIHFVAVSNWLAHRAKESSLLDGQLLSVIPNAFPVEKFLTVPASQPPLEGVDYSKRLILMGAARLDDPVKGLPHAINALNILAETRPSLADRCLMVFFGSLRNPGALDDLRFPHVHVGSIADHDVLRDLYASATAVVSSSLYETLPGTLIEGQAAGCVPVSFGEGGQGDIIDHLSTGYIARYLDDTDLARGLAWALESDTPRERLRTAVAARFSADAVARRYLDLAATLAAPRR